MGVEEGKSNGGNSTECTKAAQCLKSEANGSEFGISVDIAKGSSGENEGIRTYKRRRYARSSWESRSQEDGRACVESSSQSTDQCRKEPVGTDIHNNSCGKVHLRMDSSNGCSERHWRNAVLEHMCQSLGDDKGGVQVCIREALAHFGEVDHTTRVKEFGDHDEDRRKYLPTCSILSGPQNAASGHVGVISNGSSNKSNHHTITAMCQHAFFNILVSEKFASLCKLLLENFQGINADRIFDLNLINSRMKKGDYEHSPTLFSTDMQQLWRKLQGIGTELISLAKGLSEMSRTPCNEQYTLESDSHTKLEQMEDCSVYGVCSCRRCGHKADGRDCLVCDSCEEMYHVSCIEPAVKEIPPKSWYCVSCTAKGIGSPHENCVVCERLNASKTIVGVGDESVPTNEETVNELGENSNWSTDDGIQLSSESVDPDLCKICGVEVDNGEMLRVCGHPYCLNKYYHVRCLTDKQLRVYGPRWYCYSCLCRACLTDQDDDKIVLCDGCDHAFHIYCMEPPHTSIPEGKWFCRKCDAAIQAIRRAKEAYEKNKKNETKKGEGSRNWNEKGDDEVPEQGRGGMEVLLYAVNTLDHEEDMAATKMKS